MKNASTKFLAITFTFIVYAAILFFIMVALPLRAQTNAPDKVGIGNAAATPERIIIFTERSCGGIFFAASISVASNA